ncbi:O-antigen biosynthesis glycosyltransferase WbnK [Orchesella cincta]|uniref:L-Fucosyltransferase n=1 Tax=Orchesella cincta TaxID=48709 RepID=A0A1D2MNI2_ORCCI|nr:O-antigen biosynthesis glycosyltransferase WbnK [Orchesella cincta]
MKTIFLKRNKIRFGIILTICSFLLVLTVISSIKRGTSVLKWRTSNTLPLKQDIFNNGREIKIFFEKTLPPPGILVRTKGGIGNQLFQYACSYALSKNLNRTLYTWYNPPIDSATRQFQPENREFALDYFNIPIDNVVDETTIIRGLTTLSDERLLEGGFDNTSSFLELRENGYCQSETYWEKYKEEIKSMFQLRTEALNLPKLKEYINRITNSESVAVHVRRGDFTNPEIQNFYFVPISYQRNAIRKIVHSLERRGTSKPVFFVFSDDIWGTSFKLRDLERKYEIVYVSGSGTTSIEEFYLMTLCKHNIVPDSTFSWWAAYINANPDKIVIASSFSPEFWKLWEICVSLFLLSLNYSVRVQDAVLQWKLDTANPLLARVDDIFKSGREMKIFFDKRLPPPGVLVRTKGGIGNQLFQYACSYALSKNLNQTLYTWYIPSKDPSTRRFQPGNREYALDHFHIPIDNVVDGTSRISGLVSVTDEELLENRFDNSSSFLKQREYCQSETYWRKYKKEITAMFQPRLESLDLSKIQRFIEKIRNSESVAVHVRRGDFTKPNLNFFYLPISYQRLAMRRLGHILESRGKKPTFFVFSDDIWTASAKLKDFEKKYEMVYVSRVGTTSIEDFYLMTLCKHNIIPDSTFSWWAAYLNANPEKIVIASVFSPEFWKLWKSRQEKKFYMQLHGTLYHPKDWIMIDPFSGGL